MPPCLQEGRDCYKRLDGFDDTCPVDCEGLYADVEFVNSTIGKTSKDIAVLESLMAAYEDYKKMHFKSMKIVHTYS